MKAEQPSKVTDAAATPAGNAASNSTKTPAPLSGERFGLDDVRALAQLMQEFALGEVELVRASGDRLHLSRPGGVAAVVPHPVTIPAAPSVGLAPAAPAPAAPASAPPANVHVISAPLVGTFYRSPGPEAPSFIEVGQRIRKGQTLCIIEAMKLMNELESEVDGVVVAILADNGRPVEFGQPLFHIQKG